MTATRTQSEHEKPEELGMSVLAALNTGRPTRKAVMAALGPSVRTENGGTRARADGGARPDASGIKGPARVGIDAPEEPMKKKAPATRAAAGPRWEYMVVRPTSTSGPDGEQVGPNLEAQLNELGTAGWELIIQLDNRQLLFKRPKK